MLEIHQQVNIMIITCFAQKLIQLLKIVKKEQNMKLCIELRGIDT